MITLSAPSHSGLKESFDTVEEARAAAARILDVPLDEMVEVGPVGGEDVTYCYGSQDEADEDQDGAYAVQYKSASAIPDAN